MVMNDETWHVVRNIRGVTGFLGEGNKPIPLSEDDVAALGVEKREIVVGYQVGDSVKITDGALESFPGHCGGAGPGTRQGPRDGLHVRTETPWSWSWIRSSPWTGKSPPPTADISLRGTGPRNVEGRFSPSRPNGRVTPNTNHIFIMEVLFRGTESNWIRKTADPRLAKGDSRPLLVPLWASTA